MSNSQKLHTCTVIFGVILCSLFISSAATEGAWDFANMNITQAIGIMAFGNTC